MKKIKKQYRLILFYFMLISFGLKAQVGINTEDIRGVFHLDTAADNNAVISPLSASNDVVITSDGNMGVGTITPTSRLHIKSDSPYSAFRLRTSTSTGAVLLGDSSGNAFWGITKGNGGRKFSFLPVATTINNNTTKQILLDTEDSNGIKVQSDGSYAVIIRWSPALRFTSKVRRSVQIRYELKRKRVGVADIVCQAVTDQPSMETNQYSTTFMSLVAQDVLKDDILYINVTFIGVSGEYLYMDRTWTGNTSSAKTFDTQSVIFYKL